MTKFLTFMLMVGLLCYGVISYGAEDYMPGELLVKYKSGTIEPANISQYAVQSADAMNQIRVQRIVFSEDCDLDAIKADLEADPAVEIVEYNHRIYPCVVPDDPLSKYQWHLDKIFAVEGWDITTGNEAPIALLDSGVCAEHEDMAGKLLPGWNFIDDNDDTSPKSIHGTLMAGVLAANTDNMIGMAGITWGNPIVPLVVMGKHGGSYADLAEAVLWAADHNIRIMSLSGGGSKYSQIVQDAVTYAWDRDSILFAAAGNNATYQPVYPAACSYSVGVGATTIYDDKATFSSYGRINVKIAAPGVSIFSTVNTSDQYLACSGTSPATPIAAGLAALVLSVHPDMSNQKVVDLICANADDLGDHGPDDFFGHGRVNVYATLAAAMEIEDTASPRVYIKHLCRRGVVFIHANALDNDNVDRMELYVDGMLRRQNKGDYISLLWQATTKRSEWHIVKVKAYDVSGNVGFATAKIFLP